MKSNFTIHLTTEAEIDIDDIFLWYEEQKENLGFEFIDELKFYFNQISQRPFSYKVFFDDNEEFVHVAVMNRFPYLIYLD